MGGGEVTKKRTIHWEKEEQKEKFSRWSLKWIRGLEASRECWKLCGEASLTQIYLGESLRKALDSCWV